MELVGFTLIIDDIVLPDGQTCMAQLGGGGPQTLFGFQLVSAALSPLNLPCSVGLAAGVGIDLPEPCKVRRLPSQSRLQGISSSSICAPCTRTAATAAAAAVPLAAACTHAVSLALCST
jgi:hypothetical protein